MSVCGTWHAVRADDHRAVLDAFGLSSVEPATMRLGEDIWRHDSRSGYSGPPHSRCARAYLSPVLDGWILVFGQFNEHWRRVSTGDEPMRFDSEEFRAILKARNSSRREHCAELSSRLGTVHWYASSCDGWTAWCVAENGVVVRFYDEDLPEEQSGAPLPVEAGCKLPHEYVEWPGLDEAFDKYRPDTPEGKERLAAELRRLKETYNIPDTCDATRVAEHLSVSLRELGPHTEVRGHGLVALTRCGRDHGHPPGALSI